jgi:uncharacterized membrane protein
MVRLAVLADQVVLAVMVVWAVSVVPQLVASEALMELMRLVALVVPAVMGALEVMDQQALMARTLVTLVLTDPREVTAVTVERVVALVQGVAAPRLV